MSSPMTTHQLIEARGILPSGRQKAFQNMLKERKKKARERDDVLRELVAANAGYAEIADALGVKGKGAVFDRASRLGLKIPHGSACRPYVRKVNQTSERKPVSITPNAMKAQTAMFRLLDTHFDEDAGRYADGWDDARVAKETGIAIAMVAAFRKEGFGEIKASPELTAIAGDLKTLKTMVSDLEARLAKAGYCP